MKSVIFLVLSSILFFNFIIGQTFIIPNENNPMAKITLPSDLWNFEGNNKMINISPIELGEENRLMVMIWASENPEMSNALDIITSDALAVIGSFLKDIVWDDESSKFVINNISFIALDGYGYYTNEDYSKDLMKTSIMLFLPDQTNIMAIVYFASKSADNKWRTELRRLINSISKLNN